MFDYNRILEVKEIKFDRLDKDTLIDWEILDLGEDNRGERNWICVEVWTDENNTIKILEQNDYDTEEITSKLTKEQKDHIYKLVEESLSSFTNTVN